MSMMAQVTGPDTAFHIIVALGTAIGSVEGDRCRKCRRRSIRRPGSLYEIETNQVVIDRKALADMLLIRRGSLACGMWLLP